MPLFKIYHAIKPTFMDPEAADLAAFPAGYEAVAVVDAVDIDDTFELTNHIDHDWTTNKGVLALKSRARSTSIGDVVEAEDGARYAVMGVGFRPF